MRGNPKIRNPKAEEGRSMNFVNPHFAEPRWLWLAVLAPLLLAALQRYSAWARREATGAARRVAVPCRPDWLL